jgi:hypothetical protein
LAFGSGTTRSNRSRPIATRRSTPAAARPLPRRAAVSGLELEATLEDRGEHVDELVPCHLVEIECERLTCACSSSNPVPSAATRHVAPQVAQ